VSRTCKANVSHLDENIAALWVWLNSSKSDDDLRTNEFSTSTKLQSVRVTEKISFGFVGHHCRDHGGSKGERSPPRKPTKGTLFTMILCNAENRGLPESVTF